MFDIFDKATRALRNLIKKINAACTVNEKKSCYEILTITKEITFHFFPHTPTYLIDLFHKLY